MSETEFVVRVRTGVGNAFATPCRGTVESTPTGSVIRIRLGLQQPLGPFVRAVVGLIALGAVLVIARGGPMSAPLAEIVLGAVLFITLVRTLTQRQERTLLRHLYRAAQVEDPERRPNVRCSRRTLY